MIEKFKEKFRLERDEQGDPIIKCRNSFIYEGGDSWLGLWLETARPNSSIKAIKVKFPNVTMPQCGDGECVIRYPIAGFKTDCKFLAAVGAHRRKYLSEERRAALVEAGKAHQFGKRDGAASADRAPESARTL